MQRGKYIRTSEIRAKCALAQGYKKIMRRCSICEKEIFRSPSLMLNKNISCSKECLLKIRAAQLLGNDFCAREKSPKWKGGINEKNGRIQVSFQGEKRRYRNRVVVENIIGRLLKRTEVVHHIDENKKNDNAKNLFIFRHLSAHKRWHDFLRRHSLKGLLVSNIQQYVSIS